MRGMCLVKYLLYMMHDKMKIKSNAYKNQNWALGWNGNDKTDSREVLELV